MNDAQSCTVANYGEKNVFYLTGKDLNIQDLFALSDSPSVRVALDQDARKRMNESRVALDNLLERGETIYGVNTNMGGMVKWLVPPNLAPILQRNLILSVATNVGEYFEDIFVRAAMICRINSLVRGNSSVSISVVDTLVNVLNSGIVPCVPKLGSLGTSGDLGPLASIAMVVIGEGKAKYEGNIMSGAEALDLCGISPATLSYKDGLALINGTSFMTAVLGISLYRATNILNNYIAISSITLGCLNARIKPISPVVHKLKSHHGQLEVAEILYNYLENTDGIVDDKSISKQLSSEKSLTPTEGSLAVEDPYSIRCTPHILGPVLEELYAIEVCVNREINSSNDNPLVDLESGEVFHCGHFHGQYISLAADRLTIALTTLSNLADRRIDRLLDIKKNGTLKPFLSDRDAGVRLGFMGAQFMASSVVSELRTMCTPVSVQSLPSTADFQDIVSLGLVAARKAYDATTKCAYVVGCELVLAAQAADLEGYKCAPKKPTKLYNELRNEYPFSDVDRSLTEELEFAKDIVLRSFLDDR